MLYILSFAILLLYILKISEYIFAWVKTKHNINKIKNNNNVFVSVIIPFRNEESNITKLIHSLKSQTYNKSYFEVILIDDNSNDKSLKTAKQNINNYNNFKIIQLTPETSGKKNAILKGIETAKGELIITSDADCTFNKNWISEIATFYKTTNYKLISAPVKIIEDSFFSNIQAIEFFSLNLSAGAAILNKKPILINAANMAFSKKYFLKILDGIKKNTTSGDDIFLLLNFKKLYPDKIGFIKSDKAIVKTNAQKNIKKLYNQRKRWISKTNIYTDANITYTAILNTITNLLTITLTTIYFITNKNLILLINFIFFKILIDFIFFNIGNKTYKIKNLNTLFLLTEIIYPFYILILLTTGFFNTYTWKDRKYKT